MSPSPKGKQPSDLELRAARAEFRELLTQQTSEPAWQAFFATNPFVLSRSLPVRVEPSDILPLGRPGRSEPDFLIYPASQAPVPVHGLIELKTHVARVTTIHRKTVLGLTRDAASAIRQLQVYDRDFDRFSPVQRAIAFSSPSYLFVVMGLTTELDDLRAHPSLLSQLQDLVPPQVRWLSFDQILSSYESGLPQQAMVLVPDVNALRSPLAGTQRWPTVFVRGKVYKMLRPHARRILDSTEPSLAIVHPMVANSFRYTHPLGSRFTGPDRGALYASLSEESAIAEFVFHQSVELAEIGAPDTQKIAGTLHRYSIAVEVHDLRTTGQEIEQILSPTSGPYERLLQ